MAFAARPYSAWSMARPYSVGGPPTPGFERVHPEAAARVYRTGYGGADELVRLGAYDYEYQSAGLGDLGQDGAATWWPTSWQGWVGVALVAGAVAGLLYLVTAE